jgi:phage terminase large subunit-like protein
VLEGLIQNDSWFAYVAQLDACEKCRDEGKTSPNCDQCDQWTDEGIWVKVNPNLGISIRPKYLREQVAEALEITSSPTKSEVRKRLMAYRHWSMQSPA